VRREVRPGAPSRFLKLAGHSSDPSDRPSHRASRKIIYYTPQGEYKAALHGGGTRSIDLFLIF
jgi:hypothetical protein